MLPRALLSLLALAGCSPSREPPARDATAVREVSCLVVTVALDDVPEAPGAVRAATRLDNRCGRAAEVDLSAIVARVRDASTHEGRMLRLGVHRDDRFALASAVTVERAIRFDPPSGLAEPASVCVDLGPAVVDEVAVPAACFERVGGRWAPTP